VSGGPSEAIGAVPWGRTFSHFGYVVDDLEATAGRWSDTFGFEWTPVQRRERSIRMEGAEQSVDLAVTWSLEGPVRVELLEAVEGTVWERRHGHPIHHVCYWVPDLATEGARLLALGWRVEVTEPGPDEVNGFAYLVDTDGFRVEPKPEDGKATIERWLAGGSLYD
jgi:catechol 2,3-dioxygenase-like lactoylglutathione lyase family enzyme